jgi:hypothetical protein
MLPVYSDGSRTFERMIFVPTVVVEAAGVLAFYLWVDSIRSGIH